MPLGALGWAVVGGAAVGAIGSNLAAGTQASAQREAANTQLGMFNTINAQEQPFIQGGYGAEAKLNELLGIAPQSGGFGGPAGGTFTGGGSGWMPTPGGGMRQILTNGPGGGPGSMPVGGAAGAPAGQPADFGQLTRSFSPQDFLNNLDPGYQFQLQTGQQALRNADTPGVGALSGPALKDLMGFNQSMAATGYQSAFNRFQTQNQNIFNRLSQIAGLGQSAASQVGTSGTALGTGIAQAQAGAGASQAGGIVGSTNAIGGSAIPLAYLMQNQGTSPTATNPWSQGVPGGFDQSSFVVPQTGGT